MWNDDVNDCASTNPVISHEFLIVSNKEHVSRHVTRATQSILIVTIEDNRQMRRMLINEKFIKEHLVKKVRMVAPNDVKILIRLKSWVDAAMLRGYCNHGNHRAKTKQR